MSIEDFSKKSKAVRQRVLVLLPELILLFLATLLSFGLGRLSVFQTKSGEAYLYHPPPALGVSATAQAVFENQNLSITLGSVVASKTGRKYHLPWCSGAKQISEKNKITFGSVDEAKKAGYTPAANCPGL